MDWSDGAYDFYSKSHQNVRVVGREIGLLIRFLNLETGMYFQDVHIIGMSLGAHAVGYAGEFQPGIARITGLYKMTVFPTCGLRSCLCPFLAMKIFMV